MLVLFAIVSIAVPILRRTSPDLKRPFRTPFSPVLPIVSAISREVFVQVPRANIEAALALGATRWEMIRMTVLPFGKSALISGSMLGLGRALGETMAVATVLSPSFLISLHVLNPGGGTFAQNIASKFNEAE